MYQIFGIEREGKFINLLNPEPYDYTDEAFNRISYSEPDIVKKKHHVVLLNAFMQTNNIPFDTFTSSIAKSIEAYINIPMTHLNRTLLICKIEHIKIKLGILREKGALPSVVNVTPTEMEKLVFSKVYIEKPSKLPLDLCKAVFDFLVTPPTTTAHCLSSYLITRFPTLPKKSVYSKIKKIQRYIHEPIRELPLESIPQKIAKKNLKIICSFFTSGQLNYNNPLKLQN